MHLKSSSEAHGPYEVPVKFVLEDPESLVGDEAKKEHEIVAARGETLLELALEHGINIEHACGGVCACSTCHVYIESGEQSLTEPEDDELDRVEEAPGLQINSRLSCQCRIIGRGPILVRVPAWNRNAVKEVPH